MSEDFDRLKARKDALVKRERSKIRRAAFDEAVAIVKAERCDETSTTHADMAYNNAIRDAVAALTAARDKEQK